jgi:hypothetical protein
MPVARPAMAARKEDGPMFRMALCVVALVLAGWLAAAPAAADCYNCTNIEVFAAPPAPQPPAMYAPPYPYYYPAYPPVAFYQGSWWDADYRDIRYNRYYQRYQPPPQVRGYTFR